MFIQKTQAYSAFLNDFFIVKSTVYQKDSKDVVQTFMIPARTAPPK